MDWHDLLSAIALCMVLEGLVPFIYPALSKRILQTIARMGLLVMRLVGGVSMTLGLVLLYIVR